MKNKAILPVTWIFLLGACQMLQISWSSVLHLFGECGSQVVSYVSLPILPQQTFSSSLTLLEVVFAWHSMPESDDLTCSGSAAGRSGILAVKFREGNVVAKFLFSLR